MNIYCFYLILVKVVHHQNWHMITFERRQVYQIGMCPEGSLMSNIAKISLMNLGGGEGSMGEQQVKEDKGEAH